MFTYNVEIRLLFSGFSDSTVYFCCDSVFGVRKTLRNNPVFTALVTNKQVNI